MTKPSRLDVALQAARNASGRAEDVARLRAKLQSRLAMDPLSHDASGPVAVGGLAKMRWFVGCALGVALFGTVAWRVPRPAPHAPMPRVVEARPSSVARSGPASAPQTPTLTTDALPSGPKKPPARPRARSHAVQTEQSAAPEPAAEIALITRAQGLIERQPTAALAVLLEHERQFPRGLLAEERDVLRFDAERTLGHAAQALAHAEGFLLQHPGSAQSRRIERWLAARQNAAPLHNPEPEPLPTP